MNTLLCLDEELQSQSLERRLRAAATEALTLELAIQRERVVLTRDLLALAVTKIQTECDQALELLQATDPRPIKVWMCAWCGRQYDARGQYVSMPRWAEPAEWSHGICPNCLAQELQAHEQVHGGAAQ